MSATERTRRAVYGNLYCVVQSGPRTWQVGEPSIADFEFVLLPEKFDNPNDARREAADLNGDSPRCEVA